MHYKSNPTVEYLVACLILAMIVAYIVRARLPQGRVLCRLGRYNEGRTSCGGMVVYAPGDEDAQ
jgi:hypothetical protein